MTRRAQGFVALGACILLTVLFSIPMHTDVRSMPRLFVADRDGAGFVSLDGSVRVDPDSIRLSDAAVRPGLIVSAPQARRERIEPFGPTSGVASYFLGDDPANWRRGLPLWSGLNLVDAAGHVIATLADRDGLASWQPVHQPAPWDSFFVGRSSAANQFSIDRVREPATPRRPAATGVDPVYASYLGHGVGGVVKIGSDGAAF